MGAPALRVRSVYLMDSLPVEAQAGRAAYGPGSERHRQGTPHNRGGGPHRRTRGQNILVGGTAAMIPVYRGAFTSLILAVVTVASILWHVRQSDLKAFATKSDIQHLATKADIAAINKQRQS